MTETLHEVQMEEVTYTLSDAMEVGAVLHREFDLWIGALGFEERCYAIAQALADGESTCKLALICSYDTNPDQNKANEESFLASVDRIAEAREWLQADQMALTDRLRARLGDLQAEMGRPLRIGWDVSVASNRLILEVGPILLEAEAELEIFYTEAATYFPTQDEYYEDPGRWSDGNRLGLDRGTLNVRTSSEFPGEHSSQLPNRVVIIPGYNRDRVRKVISNVDSQFLIELTSAPISWLIGDPHSDKDKWRERAVAEIHDIPADHESLPVSTFDYCEVLSVLEQTYSKWGLRSNITLAPMGSKMQAFGCVLFCIGRPDVRVMFAQPAEYNAARYTEGVRTRWAIQVGRTDELLERLKEVGTLVRLDDKAPDPPSS